MSELTRKEEQILLAVHFLQNDAYLITIRDRITQMTATEYAVGTIYAPLNRLHINGYLDSHLKETRESNKPVRYYTVTKQGYYALAELKKLTEEMWEGFVTPVFETS
ncbi:MAG: helix-turn-helix transcriptional regulator [bacterium]|jgi:DNA-binding PadR family transcriptional regulator|nr:helix-turn-helix transcriptional regulator [bacterium]